MEMIMIPGALFVFYGGLIFACGGALGFLLARRHERLRGGGAEPPNQLERRVELLERDLELSHARLAEVREEREFMRRLGDAER